MVTAKQGLISNAPRLCNPHGVASLHFSKVAEPAILNRLKSGKSVVSQTALAYSSVGAMSALGVRREKAALSSGCKPHPATAPAGSNRSSHGGNEVAEAFDSSGAN